MNKTRIAILGYGNLGRGVEIAVNNSNDMELVGVFTRRDNLRTVSGTPSINVKDIIDYKNKIDVLILCGGSATDLPIQGPEMLADFNTVDSFDTHAKIPAYFNQMDEIAKKSGHLGVISVGWDPGLFSIARMMFGAMLPNGVDYTFWGKGVSQGHSDAIRRISGVKNAIQYTIPKREALDLVRGGTRPELTTRDKHLRECFVVAEDGADLDKIKQEIVNMPNYFSDYDTIVNFITEDELKANHSKMPHGGFVIRSGETSSDINNVLELAIKIDSNPQFTASILVAYARAVGRLVKEGAVGAKTVLDIPLGYLSPKSDEDLRKNLL